MLLTPIAIVSIFMNVHCLCIHGVLDEGVIERNAWIAYINDMEDH